MTEQAIVDLDGPHRIATLDARAHEDDDGCLATGLGFIRKGVDFFHPKNYKAAENQDHQPRA